VQVRDVMTREVSTVGPDTSAKYAAEVMAGRGYAALPVVDDDSRLVGIVAEADVLHDRLPSDPRLHMRRNEGPDHAPPLLVRGVMTVGVRTADAGADIADVARLFIDERLRSVPVVEHGRLVGIVSRRDLLAALVRPDQEIRRELLQLVEGYTGEADCWDVTVTEGVATVARTGGTPEVPAQAEEGALRSLAHTVPGVVSVRILPGPDPTEKQDAPAAAQGSDSPG
jgi:CBS domain-containing protein